MVYHSDNSHDPYGPDAYGPTGPQSGVDARSGADTRPGGGRGTGGVPDGVLVGGLGLGVCLTLLVWTSTTLAGWLQHGAWPSDVTFPRTAGAVRGFLTAPSDITGAWPQADPATLPSAGMLWLVFAAQLVVIFAAVFWTVVRIGRWRQRRAAARNGARHSSASVAGGAPGGAAVPPAAELPLQAAGADGRPEDEDPALATHPVPGAETTGPVPAVSAAPGAGIGPGPAVPAGTPTPRTPSPAVTPAAVLRAPGGAVVIDPDGALHERTERQRGRLGPVHVYDPGHITGTPLRLRWAPHRGCEDVAAARARAAALLAPVRPRQVALQLDAETADTLLRCYLHAVALSGASFTQVYTWVKDGAAGGTEPLKVLRGHGKAAPGLAMECEAALTAHEERRDAALALIGRALAGLEQPPIRQSCSPGRADALTLDRVADAQGTLYVVGSAAATAPFRLALLSAVEGTLHPVGTGDG